MKRAGCFSGGPPGVELVLVLVLVLLMALPAGGRLIAGGEFKFRDTTRETGLWPGVEGIHGHGAGWGDTDGDGWIDLYVGTFHTEGPGNRLIRNRQGRFELDEQPAVQISTRATGVVFADLDNDGDLDLYVGSMPSGAESGLAERIGRPLAGCSLFRNDSEGNFTNVSEGNGACPRAFGGRSAAVLDFDGDGLLDLAVGEDPLPGYNGSPSKSSRLFRNLGGLQFEDVSRRVGLPEGIPGLGVAAGDLNNDTWPDLFFASNNGGNRLFLNDGRGRFFEAPGSRETFDWPSARGDNMVCGVAFGDVNRDGLLEVILGQHYDHPWREPVPNRLYLNRGIEKGIPAFEDITEEAGLIPLPMKAPHVEVQDFDNDGWPDLMTSVVKFGRGEAHPVIFKHVGLGDGLPRFRVDALAVNDFPNAEDKAVRRSGELFEKILREGTVFYAAAAPSGDYDRDGRLDLFLASWWTNADSMLLRNETSGGNWLDVRVRGGEGLNRQGVGTRVQVYHAGKVGELSALLGCGEISVGYGYASGQVAVAHFGLGDVERVDVRLILPHGRGEEVRRNVRANQSVALKTASR